MIKRARKILKEMEGKAKNPFNKTIQKFKLYLVMKVFFEYVQISPSSIYDNYFFADCKNPYLTIDKLCSVSKQDVNEEKIIMWISDLANAYFKSQGCALTAKPVPLENGIWQFLMAKEEY